jgi:hypothetical protein
MPSRNCEKQDVSINFVRERVHSIREVGWKGVSKLQLNDHEWEVCEALALVLRMSSMGAAARTVSMTKTPLHYVIQPQQTLITDNCITPARLLQGPKSSHGLKSKQKNIFCSLFFLGCMASSTMESILSPGLFLMDKFFSSGKLGIDQSFNHRCTLLRACSM